MENVKAPTSSSYRDYLISRLKNYEHAAGYIAVMLELDEEGYDPVMFSSALEEVVEAREQLNDFSPLAQKYYPALEKVVEARKQLGDYSLSAQQHHGKLDQILAQTGGEQILTLIEFLNALGYRIAVVPKDDETTGASDY
ncbi:MAG: transcriptional regulator [Calothrix sp. FI2-JRJ7]|jgi:DNA-binding phage protein|nr:transcriptional regulator [Calothrix sp. FI2-JRJ7]